MLVFFSNFSLVEFIVRFSDFFLYFSVKDNFVFF